MISNLTARIERLKVMLPHGDNARIAVGTMKVFLLKIIGIGLLFSMEIVIARVIGRAAFGRFVFVFNLAELAASVFILGFNTSTIKQIQAYLVEGRLSLARGFLRFSKLFILLFSIIGTLGIWVYLTLGNNQMSLELLVTLKIGILLIPLITAARYYHDLLLTFKRILAAFLPYDIFRPGMLMAVLLLGNLLIGRDLSDYDAISILLMVMIITVSGLFVFSHNAVPVELKSGNREYSPRQWIVLSFQLFLVDGFVLVLSRLSIILTGALTSTESAGLYSAADNISRLTQLGLISVLPIVKPIIAKLYQQGRVDELQKAVSTAGKLVLLATVPIGLGLIAVGPFVLNLYGAGFVEAYPILVALVIGRTISSIFGVAIIFAVMTDNQSIAAWSLLGAIIFLPVISYLTVPLIGIMGIAFSVIVVLVFSRGVTSYMVLKRTGVDTTFYSWLSKVTKLRRNHAK